jgi:hypothetical protein
MIPFTMMKEANVPEVKGTAAGVMNFLVFVITGIMSPFISRLMVPVTNSPPTLHEFQVAFFPLICGMVLAIVLGFIIRETGSGRPAKESGLGTRKQDRPHVTNPAPIAQPALRRTRS